MGQGSIGLYFAQPLSAICPLISLQGLFEPGEGIDDGLGARMTPVLRYCAIILAAHNFINTQSGRTGQMCDARGINDCFGRVALTL